MKEESKALEKYYAWIPHDCLDFFRAHEYHDEGHGAMVVDVIKQHCMEEHRGWSVPSISPESLGL